VASAKDIVREILEGLPDDCSLQDVVHQLYRQSAGEVPVDDDRRLVVHGEILRQARRYMRD